MHFEIKEALKAAGWAVASSSDGTTYNPSGDQITHGSSGAGGFGNTNAWVRLQSPAAGLPEITMQRTVNNTTWRFKIGRAAFNAGSPGATQTPTTTTASDEIVFLGGGTDASPTGGSANFGAGTDGGHVLRGGVDDTLAKFWFACSSFSGTPGTFGIFMLDPLSDTIAGDAFPYVVMARNTDFSVTFYSSDAPTGQYSYVASATPSVAVQMPAVKYEVSTTLAFPNELPTTLEGEFRTLPVKYERRAAAANPGYKGISTMLRWWAPGNVNSGHWVPVSISAPNDHLLFGEGLVPWDGTRPRL